MLRVLALCLAVAGWAYGAIGLTQNASQQEGGVAESQRVIAWVNERNAVLGQMMVAPLRVSAAVRELSPLLDPDVRPDERREAFDSVVAELERSRTRVNEAYARLSVPPTIGSDEDGSRRLYRSWQSVDLIRERSNAILDHSIEALRTIRDAPVSDSFAMRVLSLDAEIALLEANILQNRAMRSNDMSNPGTLGNIASEQALQASLDLSRVVRSRLTGEPEPDASEVVEAFVEYHRMTLECEFRIRRAIEEWRLTMDQALAEMTEAERSRWRVAYDRLAAVWQSYIDGADLLVEQASIFQTVIQDYPHALSAEERLAQAAAAIEQLNALTLRGNELLARRGQLATEVSRAAENL